MDFEVRWVDVLMGGLTMVVGQPGVVGGREAIVVRSEIRADGMLAVVKGDARAQIATMIDLGDGVAIATAGSFDDMYDGDVLDESYKGTGTVLPWKPFERQLGSAPAYETLSALGMLRAWDAGDGERMHFYGKVNGFIYRTDVVFNGREVIKTASGRVPTRRLDGIVTPARADLNREHSDESYRWIMWLSDDARRAPVRLHVQSGFGGMVEVELVDYEAP